MASVGGSIELNLLAAAPALPIEQDFALREEHEEPRYSDGGGLTLGHKLDSVWEGLLAAGVAGCPVCGDRMERRSERAHCQQCGRSGIRWAVGRVRGRFTPLSQPTLTPSAPGNRPNMWSKLRFSIMTMTTCLIGHFVSS